MNSNANNSFSHIARLSLFATLVLACVLVPVSAARAQWVEPADISRPLVENEPFDLLTLQTDNVLLKLAPREKRLPSPLPNQGDLIFEYFTDSEGLLTVSYAEIKEYKTFQELLLDEAEAWMEEKQYGPAFRNLLWIYDHGGAGNRKVTTLLRECLFKDGIQSLRNGDYEMTLSIFEDIYQQDPNFSVPGIDDKVIDIVMQCYDQIVSRQFKAEEYGTVKGSLEAIRTRYPEDFAAIARRWQKAFNDKSDELMAKCRKFASANKGREAHLAVRQAEQITPGRPEVEQLQQEILDRFPLIVVGVNQPASDADPQRMEHWGARRVGRLTQRMLVELSGVSEEGGQYSFLNGQLSRKDRDGYEYQFTIDPGQSAFGAPTVTSYDVAARIGSLADVKSTTYSEAWAKILESVAIDNETQVTIKLRRAFVRPEALIDVTYSEPSESGQPVQNGVYVLTEQNDEFSTFDLNPRIQRDSTQQYPVVIEQQFSSGSEAVTELLKGNIDMVDRVPVNDLSRLKRKPGVQARAYLVPTIHMLVPKVRGELEKSVRFRRGLSHAIDRQRILEQIICGGQLVSGCEIISGPLPIGTEENDQISYGYNFKVRPPAFNTKLGQVLVQMSLLPRGKTGSPEDGSDKEFLKAVDPPSLTLAHPRTSTATQACFTIAQDWSKAGVPTTPRVLAPGESFPPDDNWDLLYVEVSMEEPLADIARIVGPGGFAEQVSAPVDQTLAELGYTQTWQSACANLRLLHQQVATDLSVIPLWQVKEHFAYRTTVRNVGRELVHLYQNIQRWRIDIRPEEETE